MKTLGELRGAAMKLGQLASQYSDVLPPALAEQLKLLQREVKPLPFEEVEPLLAAQWTAAQSRKIAHIEPVALAAASIGQVLRARLKDGSAVVVKLRYAAHGSGARSGTRASNNLFCKLLLFLEKIGSMVLPPPPGSPKYEAHTIRRGRSNIAFAVGPVDESDG